MIIPVRCFSCGKVIGSLWEKYQKLLEEGKSKKEALDTLKIERFCCRSAIMSNVESINIIGEYKFLTVFPVKNKYEIMLRM